MLCLTDCNNFYASCERLFDPSLAGKPLIVLSNNDGCVIARSQEAKDLGIKMGAPAFFMKELISRHRVKVRSSNYALYGDMSARVMETLSTFAPRMEVYSIDEAFLDLTGMAVADLEAYGRSLRETVLRHTGIPVSLGMAGTKTLAKAANKWVKQSPRHKGVLAIRDLEDRKRVLSGTPVAEVWGIGKQYASWLQHAGVSSAWDLSLAPVPWIRKKMGVTGVRLQEELNGISCLELEEIPPSKKGICTSRSFGSLLQDKATIAQAVATHATRCAEKLRGQESCTGLLQVFLHTNAYRSQDAQHFPAINIPLLSASNSTAVLIRYALGGLDAIFREGYNYKKAGVIVSELVPQDQVQLSVFQSSIPAKDRPLLQAIDAINAVMGKDMVRYAAAGYGRAWKLKQELLSPCYTTNYRELLKIRI